MKSKQSFLANFSNGLVIASLSFTAHGAGVNSSSDIAELNNITVNGTSHNGDAVSASMGIVVAEQIEQRPISRAGEILETVPGLIVTQHSGEGKANQYFLRGFNLDHGTDMATFLDGMPINNRTHGHGQGYTDINFLIPEMIESLDYKKGPYYASEGDFANAGAVRLHTKSSMDNNLVKLGFGEFGYQRALLAGGNENLVAAFDASQYDGPWQSEQDIKKTSAFFKYSFGDVVNGGNVSVMSYDNSWNATDQVPQRLVDEPGFDRFDNTDEDSGGETHRRSINLESWNTIAGKELKSNVYVIDYGLELFANHTYALDTVNEDEFRQHDERTILGGSIIYDALPTVGGEWQLGLDLRQDLITDVGVSGSQNRTITERHERHKVDELSVGLFAQNNHAWTNQLKTQLGLRWDYIQANTKNRLNGLKSDDSDTILSPKLNVIYSSSKQTHWFANYGQGFHSNDARGFAEKDVPALVKSEGIDLGVQTQVTDELQLAASLWWLTLDSELIFVGDDGTTEASDESERRGVEASIFWQPKSWLIVDSDLAFSRARINPKNGSQQHIPGAIERVASLGVSVHDLGPWEAGIHLRHFGEFALNEDNSQRSDAVTLLNAQLGYDFTQAFNGSIEVINLTNEESNDITYLYESQLPGEAAPVEDVHFHPVEPRMVRASVSYEF